MIKDRNEQANRISDQEGKAPKSEREVYESGVVPKGLVVQLRDFSGRKPWRAGEHPPWSIVESYLTSGEHRELIEEHMRRSRAFADVIEALRNDEEERDDSVDLEGSAPEGADSSREPPRSGRGHLRLVR